MKTFIFGRRDDDPKGPKEEHGEVRVDAPSVSAARAEFARQMGGEYRHDLRTGDIVNSCRDPRIHIVRAEETEAAAAAPKKKR